MGRDTANPNYLFVMPVGQRGQQSLVRRRRGVLILSANCCCLSRDNIRGHIGWFSVGLGRPGSLVRLAVPRVGPATVSQEANAVGPVQELVATKLRAHFTVADCLCKEPRPPHLGQPVGDWKLKGKSSVQWDSGYRTKMRLPCPLACSGHRYTGQDSIIGVGLPKPREGRKQRSNRWHVRRKRIHASR